MVTAVGLVVLPEGVFVLGLAARVVQEAGLGQLVADGADVGVVVDEVVAGVVGRVDVDELDLAGVGGAQELEGLEVVALDVEVPRGVEVLGAFADGAEGGGGGGVGGITRGALAGPLQAVALLRPLDDRLGGEGLAEEVEIHGQAGRPLGYTLGEKSTQFRHLFLRQIRRRLGKVLKAHDVRPFTLPTCSSGSVSRPPVPSAADGFPSARRPSAPGRAVCSTHRFPGQSLRSAPRF